MRARFLVFNIEQINATAKHKIAYYAKDSRRALPFRFLLLRARFSRREDSVAACAIRRHALVHTSPLAYFFLPPLAAFAARAASSAAMASCATFG